MFSLLVALAGCEALGGKSESRIDTSQLWIAEDGRYHVFRYLDAGATAGAADTGTVPESQLLLLWSAGGCADGAGWRVEMRVGTMWADAQEAGALHFDDGGGGLAICAVEETTGTVVPLDPPVPLWTSAALYEGDTISAGPWTVDVWREEEIVTYYGMFGNAVGFRFAGGDTLPAGWALHFAPSVGPIVIEGSDFSADVAYFR